ncbi:MAG TPA: N-acetylglutaminylglutamine amidotransferase [Nitriliruptorales bacterium]
MCGLAGEVRQRGRADLDTVARMTSQQAPRGPDGEGVWAHDNVAFGHRRLSIIDLTQAGSQPMRDPALGLTIVFNGCIYNHVELRDELAAGGHRFFSTSDTEVVVKAWAAWGESALDRFQGMFAFAIHERDSGRVVLARDRFGIKPLYLDQQPDRLRFASTLPALLAAGGVNTDIDRHALHHYLSFHSVVPSPRTILAGIRKLPPATVMTIEPDGRTRERTWWAPTFTRDADRAGWSECDWQDAVLASLRRAVEWRLVADVDVGVLLSGGVDSSLVVGLLAEAGQRRLATFSIGFSGHADIAGDEFEYSDLIARTFGTDHHRIRIADEEIPPALDQAIAAMSEPMVSHDCVAFWLLAREVSKHVKVVQSGQGADEVFGGYHWYPPMAKVDIDAVDMDEAAAVDRGVGAYREAFFDRDHAAMAALVAPEHRIEDVSSAFVRDHFSVPGADTSVDRALRIDSTVMLVDDPVKRVDNMTMAHGLEARVPFLDHDVLEVAARMPPELKLAHDGKGVLKDAARRVIPSEVIDRRKGYFAVPALTHLSGPTLAHVRDALESPEARRRGLFRRPAVADLLADPNASLTPLRVNKLWQIGLLELWLRAHGL